MCPRLFSGHSCYLPGDALSEVHQSKQTNEKGRMEERKNLLAFVRFWRHVSLLAPGNE